MQINTDLSSNNAALALLQNQTESNAPASSTQTGQSGQTSSQLDSSLQRLTETPAGLQDADWAIQDEAGADHATSFASMNILNNPGMALTSQANQLSQNVLNLLQSIG